MNERQTIDRGWYYVLEPEQGRWAPDDRRITADDGTVLTRRLHGHPGRVEVVDASGRGLSSAALVRAGRAVGDWLEERGHGDAEVLVELAPEGTPAAVRDDERLTIVLDGVALAAAPSHHLVVAEVSELLDAAGLVPGRRDAPAAASLPARPAPRALFFESLMNTDMPHNDKEISQGVLHMVSPLAPLDTEVVLVNAKMPIEGEHRPVQGLERLIAALETGPIHLVGITLLEGYWDGVCKLIHTIRELGCDAHIAVGGVMPSLAPEHVAAHLPEVSFVCRGAGEYFVPRLAQLVGDRPVSAGFTEAQRRAFLAMDGMIVVERGPSSRMLHCHSARTRQVDSLDRVPLDLSHVQAHHIEGGIEISTSRGCIHKCSFCSILGRESYQARSAGGIFDVLSHYEARFHELYGEHVPDNAYRVHISDDDFACDRDRAKAFFERLLDTPFRLSSVQVAVGDLCRREGGKLLAEPDHALLDAMQARCFADHDRPIPKTDYYEDHKSRDWSSFLQIGVETYADREIARLGKGYKRVHVRTIVAELARRDLHMDGYFILSNADTTTADLVEVFSEVARLKLRFPEHFHMRFPVVQHLVSYFTAASHRRHVRRGRRHVMKLRGEAKVAAHPELDYPFVDHDVPMDPWVERTVARPFVTDQGMYTGNLEVLSGLWRDWLRDEDDPEQRTAVARLLRQLDDRPRRLVFEMLRQAWFQEDDGWPEARLDREQCLDTAERVLGDHASWFGLLRFYLHADRERRLLLAVTGRGGPAPESAVREAIELLLATDQPEACLHLLTGDAEADVPYLLDIVDLARARADDRSRRRALRVLLDADGWEATPEAAAALRDRHVEVQAVRTPHDPLAHGLAERLATCGAAGLDAQVILRVGPAHVEALPAAWRALRDAGAPGIGLEFLPADWSDDDAARLGRALFALADELGGATAFLGLDGARERSGRLLDVAVDATGGIGRSDGLDADGRLAPTHRLGHVDDLSNVDRHHLQLADPRKLSGVARVAELDKRIAAPRRVLQSFVAWARERRDTPAAGVPVR